MKSTIIKSKGLRGEADIRLSGKTWQIKLAGDLYEFDKSEAPKGAVAGHYQVALSGRGDKWYSISPLTGTFDVIFEGFGGSKPGDPPKPMYDAGGVKTNPKTNQEFVADPSMNTLVVCRILGPRCKDMNAAVFMTYPIQHDEGNPGFCKKVGTAGQIEKWDQFLTVFGLDPDDDIPYPEGGNILPLLEKRLLAAATTAQVTILDGKAVALTGLDELPKMTAKKSAAKKTSKPEADPFAGPVRRTPQAARGK